MKKRKSYLLTGLAIIACLPITPIVALFMAGWI